MCKASTQKGIIAFKKNQLARIVEKFFGASGKEEEVLELFIAAQSVWKSDLPFIIFIFKSGDL